MVSDKNKKKPPLKTKTAGGERTVSSTTDGISSFRPNLNKFSAAQIAVHICLLKNECARLL